MGFEKVAVQDCGDSADDLSVFPGQEQADLGFFKKGVLAGKELALLEEEGRNPVGIALVYAPGQAEEGVEISIGRDGQDLHGQITPSSLPTV